MRIILNGGGDGEKIKDSYKLFANQVNGGKVLYIPLAWDSGDVSGCINWFRAEVLPYGITNIEDVTDANEITKEKLSECSGVFIGGGNTYKLLKILKETQAFKNLKEYIANNGLVMGSSAGALIFGENINTCQKDELIIKHCNDENKVGLMDTNGFNLISGFSILPHYKKVQEQYKDTKKRVEKLLNQSYKLICLPEETSLWINSNKIEIIGTKQAEIFDGNEKMIIIPPSEVTIK